jgi:hypothetical protein
MKTPKRRSLYAVINNQLMVQAFYTRLKRLNPLTRHSYPQAIVVAKPRLFGFFDAICRCKGQLTLTVNSLLILAFGLLHTADGIVTYVGLKFTDVDEVNPVLNFFSALMGLGASIFLLKLLCLSVIAYLFFTRRNINSCWSTATLASAVIFYCWVVSNNVVLVSGV